ncbi:hypothetical protein GF352_01775|nr:hypothetical protein [archaeon]
MPEAVLISYVKKKSFFHKLNPLTKLVLAVCAITLSFLLKNFMYNLILFFFIIPFAYEAKLLRQVFKPLRYLFIIFVFLFGIQSFFYPFRETVLVQLPFGFAIWLEGLLYAVDISARLLVIMVYGYLFVLTTHPGDLVSELKERGMPHWLGYVLITTLQLIPRVTSQTEVIIEAQRSRGLETQGSVIKRLKAYTPLLGPLFMGSVQNAVERAMALEARAFRAECDKTRYRDVKFTKQDKLITASSIILSIIYGVVSWLL